MTVKTDRMDARGIAQLIRMGWFRPVHCKLPGSQKVRALLVARAALQTEYVHDDKVCQRLMSVPGVGPVVAITFKTAVDDPARISRSRGSARCSD